MAPDPGALQLNVEAAQRETKYEKRDSASLPSTSPQGTRSTTLCLSPLPDDAVDSGVRWTGGQSGRSYWPGAWPERARPGAPVCLDCGQNDVQMVRRLCRDRRTCVSRDSVHGCSLPLFSRKEPA